jgi:hypothetical protein
MGYYMNQRASKFRIPKDKIPLALAAVRALLANDAAMGGGSWGPNGKVEKWFAWVDMAGFANADTLEKALTAWRWVGFVDDATGDLISLDFNGEKLGDDATLLEALAPFVDDGSYIEMSGEEGTIWRWVFNKGVMEDINAVITWPETA